MSDSTLGFRSIVALADIELGREVASVRAEYIDRFGDPPEDLGGWYPNADWQRISFALRAIGCEGRFLDVGVGAGQFVNAVALAHRFDEIHGVDRIRFTKYHELDERITRHEQSITDLPFPDNHFDVVTCMEVLEHLPADAYEAGIQELRRVCRGQLLMSVPFEEPEPIYADHQRRYVFEDLGRDFPAGELVLLTRPGMPWAMIEEWHGPGEPPERLRLAATEAVLRATPRPANRVDGIKAVSKWLPPPLRRAISRVLRTIPS